MFFEGLVSLDSAHRHAAVDLRSTIIRVHIESVHGAPLDCVFGDPEGLRDDKPPLILYRGGGIDSEGIVGNKKKKQKQKLINFSNSPTKT